MRGYEGVGGGSAKREAVREEVGGEQMCVHGELMREEVLRDEHS